MSKSTKKKKKIRKISPSKCVTSLAQTYVWEQVITNKGKENTQILLYYCTNEDDLIWLESEGYNVEAYHPNNYPEINRELYDIVICIYLLNKIDDEDEYDDIMYDIGERLEHNGNAFLVSSRNKHKEITEVCVDENQYYYTYLL